MPPIVEIANLSKTYRRGEVDIQPLAGIDLQIEDGEFLSLMGPSGSGKTTLLNIIAGIDSPSSGEVRVAGSDLARLTDAELSAWRLRNVGYVFQMYNLVPVLTAWENVELPLRISRVAPAEASGRASRILAEVGLAGRAHHRVLELSGGEQQRVAVARALVSDARVLFADEPTGELDRETGARIVRLFRGAARAGAAVCLTSHDQALIEQADRVIELEDGRIVGKEPA